MKHAPRKFDPEVVWATPLDRTPEVLAARYPHLTRQQHKKRILVAIHEAAHFVAGVIAPTGEGIWTVFVRIPNRNAPPGSGGANGFVGVEAYGLVDDMMISAAGPIASTLIDDPELDGLTPSDADDFAAKYPTWAAREEIGEEGYRAAAFSIFDKTLGNLSQHWALVDWVATAILLHAGADGAVGAKALDGLAACTRQQLKIADKRLRQRQQYQPFPEWATRFLDDRV